MTVSQIEYGKVLMWVKGYLVDVHATVVKTVGWAVVCLLVAQRLNPAALARALPMEQAGTGRNRLRRVQRWREGRPLDRGHLAPWLVRAALAIVPAGQTIVVALDTTRTGQWEVFMAGIVFRHRVLPIAWAVMPYPWPKGRFRQTTMTLVEELQAAFPHGWAWELVADRGFPSAQLFAVLSCKLSSFTIRLRLISWVEIKGVYAQVKDHLQTGRIRPGERVRATLGSGRQGQPPTAAWVVANQAVAQLPKHKQNNGTQREQARRHKAKVHHLENKGAKSKPPSEIAKKYSQTWVLFTTAASVQTAVTHYAMRMSIEETFRDWHHGWKVRQAVQGLSQEAHVNRTVGIVVVAYRLQMELGLALSQSAEGKLRRAQWTVTDRVSLFWCGQRLFSDPGYDWAPWLERQWQHLITPNMAYELQQAA